MENAILRKSKINVLPVILGIFLFVILIESVSAGVSGFSKVDISSNCPNNLCPLFNKPDGVWVFSWVDNGFTSETINANFDKDSDLEVNEKNAKQDFSIRIENSENYCTYDINREADRSDVYLFELKEFEETFWLWEVDTEQEQVQKFLEIASNIGCDVIEGSLQGYVKSEDVIVPITRKIYGACWSIRDTLGQAGSLQNLRYDFETKFLLSAEGKEDITKTLSYSSSHSTNGISELLSNNAYVLWEGNLNSGETCPTGADEYLIYNPNTFKWVITDRLNYIKYENKLSDLSLLAKETVEGLRSVYNAEQIINSLASSAVAPRSLNYNPIIDSYSASSGQLKVKLGKRIIFPKFRLFVDSDYLELEINTGIPELSKDFLGYCIPDRDVNFNMGDLYGGQFEVGLRNTGETQSNFLVKVKSCTNNLISPGISDVLQLGGGVLENADLSVVAQLENLNNVKGSCIIEAEDIVSGLKDTCTVSIEVTKPSTCVEGRQTCAISGDNHVIKTCENGNMVVTKTCQSFEICDYNDEGLPVCVLSNSGGESDYCEDCDAYARGLIFGKIFKSQDCVGKTFQNGFFCLGAILRLFAVPLFFILSLLFGIQTINRFMKGEYKWLTWLISIILAFLVALLTYFMFYVGLVIVIISLIIRIVTNFIPGLNILRKVRRKK
jgi:hypothetical protein